MIIPLFSHSITILPFVFLSAMIIPYSICYILYFVNRAQSIFLYLPFMFCFILCFIYLLMFIFPHSIYLFMLIFPCSIYYVHVFSHVPWRKDRHQPPPCRTMSGCPVAGGSSLETLETELCQAGDLRLDDSDFGEMALKKSQLQGGAPPVMFVIL